MEGLDSKNKNIKGDGCLKHDNSEFLKYFNSIINKARIIILYMKGVNNQFKNRIRRIIVFN